MATGAAVMSDPFEDIKGLFCALDEAIRQHGRDSVEANRALREIAAFTEKHGRPLPREERAAR